MTTQSAPRRRGASGALWGRGPNSSSGGLVAVVGQDHAQDDAGGDADQQIIAAIVADVMAAAWRTPQAIAIVVAHDVIAVAIVRRQTVAAPPVAIAIIGVRGPAGGRRPVIPATAIIVAVVAATVPAAVFTAIVATPIAVTITVAIPIAITIAITVAVAVMVAMSMLGSGFGRQGHR